jgi:hypothetical protein
MIAFRMRVVAMHSFNLEDKWNDCFPVAGVLVTKFLSIATVSVGMMSSGRCLVKQELLLESPVDHGKG